MTRPPTERPPHVSVIIPTYNRLPMVREAVASVRRQTCDGLELVVVDDGSDDGTMDWLSSEPDLHALRHETPQGPSAARNLGAAHSNAKYLAFLDSDDLFEPEKLAAQLPILEARPELALCHSNEIWLRNGEPLRQRQKHEKRGGWIFEHCLPMCRISPSAAVVRRDIFEALGGFDPQLEVAEDYEFWLRLTCGHEVGFVDRPLVIKRGGHPGQLSEKYGMIEKFRIEALRRVLAQAPLSPGQRTAAVRVFATKCEIFARGCEKRGRTDDAAHYRGLAADPPGPARLSP